MKKKLVAFLLVIAFAVLCIPSILAQEQVDAAEAEEKGGAAEQTETAEIRQYLFNTYAFDVSGNGEYTDITDDVFELEQNDIVTFKSSWEPADASVWVKLVSNAENGDTISVYIRSDERVEMNVPATGTYRLRVMAPDKDVNGTVLVKVPQHEERIAWAYSFGALEPDGIYQTVTDEVFHLEEGDYVTVSGAWEPANAFIWVELINNSGNGDATAAYMISSMRPELHIPSDGDYRLRVMFPKNIASPQPRYHVEGMVMIEWLR